MPTIFSRARAPQGGAPLDAPMPAKEARKLIVRGDAREGLPVRGHLDLSGERNLYRLPAGLQADSLDVSGCVNLRALPDGLQAMRLNASGCTALRSLPTGLRCFDLAARGSDLGSLPPGLRVENRLDLSGCEALTALPTDLKTGTLILSGCTNLTALPEGLNVYFLDLTGCTGLRHWPRRAALRIGRLTARDCTGLTALPPWLTQIAQLDVSGCVNLDRLPENLRISSWLDIAGSGITSLPRSLTGVRLRWHGVLVDERIVFRPETITGQEALHAPNAEVRRVLLERMGYERFMDEVRAQALDRDTDPGGERRLLRVPLAGDEDLVCLCVLCPSTERQYVLRVPPTMRSCRQAAAWIAGFDDERDYRPIAET